MAVISIEIGGQTVRAMFKTQQVKESRPLELGDSSGDYCIPSVFALDSNSKIHVGNDAIRWKYNSEFNNISVVENDMQTFTKGISALLDLIIRKAKAQCGENVDRIVIIVPNYYANNDPRKSLIRDVSTKLGVYNVDFIAVHEALCWSQVPYIDDSKYVMVFDMGHLGTNVSLLQRNGLKYAFIATKRIEGVGGFFFDGIIYRNIMEKCAPVMPEDVSCAALANDELERISNFVKEHLSAEDMYQCPVPFSNTIYTVNRKEFEDKLSAVLSPVYSAYQNIINDSNINTADISEVLLWGGSCRIPFVLNRCKYLFMQNNHSIKITNCATMLDSCFMACDGGLVGKVNTRFNFNFRKE